MGRITFELERDGLTQFKKNYDNVLNGVISNSEYDALIDHINTRCRTKIHYWAIPFTILGFIALILLIQMGVNIKDEDKMPNFGLIGAGAGIFIVFSIIGFVFFRKATVRVRRELRLVLSEENEKYSQRGISMRLLETVVGSHKHRRLLWSIEVSYPDTYIVQPVFYTQQPVYGQPPMYPQGEPQPYQLSQAQPYQEPLPPPKSCDTQIEMGNLGNPYQNIRIDE